MKSHPNFIAKLKVFLFCYFRANVEIRIGAYFKGCAKQPRMDDED